MRSGLDQPVHWLPPVLPQCSDVMRLRRQLQWNRALGPVKVGAGHVLMMVRPRPGVGPISVSTQEPYLQ